MSLVLKNTTISQIGLSIVKMVNLFGVALLVLKSLVKCTFLSILANIRIKYYSSQNIQSSIKLVVKYNCIYIN